MMANDQLNAGSTDGPVLKQPPVLFDRTQELIKKIDGMLDGDLITYWNNPDGSVCGNDVMGFYQMLERKGKRNRLYIFLKSNGGNGQASLRIVSLLRMYCQELVALIPLECASAATMIALGADKIVMGPMAYLTAVDTSITHKLSPLDRDNNRVSVSLDALNRVIKLWRDEKDTSEGNPYQSLFQHIHPLVIGDADRSNSLSVKLSRDILSFHIEDGATIEKISHALNSWYPSHDYPIIAREARAVGLNAEDMDPKIHDLLLDLNEVYSEMGQTAITDFDANRYHNNEIVNIIETRDLQLYYQVDKDWQYITEERRWQGLNDHSSWRRLELEKGKIRQTRFHIS
ncbi:MAG: hypothetical protein JXR55_00820 [Candidatus Fermentibacteraceae bacterium]|nr:hypothetical protein [Candidatus Fermentibacteraceae bacterium]